MFYLNACFWNGKQKIIYIKECKSLQQKNKLKLLTLQSLCLKNEKKSYKTDIKNETHTVKKTR